MSRQSADQGDLNRRGTRRARRQRQDRWLNVASLTRSDGSQLKNGEALRLLPLGCFRTRWRRRYVLARDNATKNKHCSSCSCARLAAVISLRDCHRPLSSQLAADSVGLGSTTENWKPSIPGHAPPQIQAPCCRESSSNGPHPYGAQPRALVVNHALRRATQAVGHGRACDGWGGPPLTGLCSRTKLRNCQIEIARILSVAADA